MESDKVTRAEFDALASRVRALENAKGAATKTAKVPRPRISLSKLQEEKRRSQSR